MGEINWSLPLEINGQDLECDWLQDENGRFHSVKFKGKRYSEQPDDFDLELFNPRFCPSCETQKAGWLPGIFSYCHLCGGKLKDKYSDNKDALGLWPKLEMKVPFYPEGKPKVQEMPKGKDFFLALLPKCNKLVAVDTDAGQIWTWSRPAQDWRTLIKPTDHISIPYWSFGILTLEGQIIYPASEGIVSLNFDPPGQLEQHIYEYRPKGAPALLGEKIIVPVLDSKDNLCIAVRGIGEREWSLLEIQTKKGSMNYSSGQWLSRPVIEDYQVHWMGQNGTIHCDDKMHPAWKAWPDGFNPVLGLPYLETKDGRKWMQGTAPNPEGNFDRAYTRIAVNASEETKLFPKVIFSSGRQCFLLNKRYDRDPWDENDTDSYTFSIKENEFLIPIFTLVCTNQEKQAKEKILICRPQIKASDRSSIVDGEGIKFSSDLFLGNLKGSFNNLETLVKFHGKMWPQVVVLDDQLWLYDPVEIELKIWDLAV